MQVRTRKIHRRRAIVTVLPFAALRACTLAFFLGRASMTNRRNAEEDSWSNPWGIGVVQKNAVSATEDGDWMLCLVNASHPLCFPAIC